MQLLRLDAAQLPHLHTANMSRLGNPMKCNICTSDPSSKGLNACRARQLMLLCLQPLNPVSKAGLQVQALCTYVGCSGLHSGLEHAS